MGEGTIGTPEGKAPAVPNRNWAGPRHRGHAGTQENPLALRRSPLLEAASTGDESALARVLARVRPTVLSWALTKTGDSDQAEDITQCVLLRLLTHLSSFRGDSSFSAWLYRITANEVASHYRREGRDRVRIGTSEPYSSGHHMSEDCLPCRIDGERLRRAVEDAVRELPPLQQLAITMVDFDGFKPCEAARTLAKSQETLRSSLCRARKRVRDLVSESRTQLVMELIPAPARFALRRERGLTSAAEGAA